MTLEYAVILILSFTLGFIAMELVRQYFENQASQIREQALHEALKLNYSIVQTCLSKPIAIRDQEGVSVIVNINDDYTRHVLDVDVETQKVLEALK